MLDADCTEKRDLVKSRKTRYRDEQSVGAQNKEADKVVDDFMATCSSIYHIHSSHADVTLEVRMYFEPQGVHPGEL